jgi:hypothetical protein
MNKMRTVQRNKRMFRQRAVTVEASCPLSVAGNGLANAFINDLQGFFGN